MPEYRARQDKKVLLPLLKAKKRLREAMEQGGVRMRVINEKLEEVEMQQMNQATILALEDSNRYINEVQQYL